MLRRQQVKATPINGKSDDVRSFVRGKGGVGDLPRAASTNGR